MRKPRGGVTNGFLVQKLWVIAEMSMLNTAEIYKFPEPVPTQQECRMADLENGYLRLANHIHDALCIV